MALPLLALGVMGGASLIGSGIQAYGQYKSAQEMSAAQAATAEANRKYAEEQFKKKMELEQPAIDVGTNYLSDMDKLIKSGELYKPYGDYTGELKFDPNTVDVTKDPGYAFRLSQGQKALDTGAGARGQLFSGAQQKALMKYGQDLGSQEYGAAYTRQEGTFDKNSARDYQDYLNRLQQYNQTLRNKVGDVGNMVGVGERAKGRVEGGIDTVTGQVISANTTQGSATGASNASPWLGMAGVGQGISNVVGDVGQAYAMGLTTPTATPAPTTTPTLYQQSYIPTNNVPLTAQGFNTSLYNQMGNP